MKEKQELKKQLIVLSIVLVLVIKRFYIRTTRKYTEYKCRWFYG